MQALHDCKVCHGSGIVSLHFRTRGNERGIEEGVEQARCICCFRLPDINRWRLVYIGEVMTPRLSIWPPGYRDHEALVVEAFEITPEEAQEPHADLESRYPLVRT
jgi:hypothetical protein